MIIVVQYGDIPVRQILIKFLPIKNESYRTLLSDFMFYLIVYVHGYSVGLYNFTLYMSVWRAPGKISY